MMKKIRELLFPGQFSTCNLSIALLILRLVFGAMMMIHGYAKLVEFSEMAPEFMGGGAGLALCVFAEFFCALGVVTGLLFRLALIPLVVNMAVAFFIAHKAALVGAASGEMALLYLAAYVALLLTGPGKYAVDRFFVTQPLVDPFKS